MFPIASSYHNQNDETWIVGDHRPLMTNLAQLYLLNKYKHHFWYEVQLINVELPLHIFSIATCIWPLKLACILSRHLFKCVSCFYLFFNYDFRVMIATDFYRMLQHVQHGEEEGRCRGRESLWQGIAMNKHNNFALSHNMHTGEKKHRNRQVSIDTFAQHV